MEDTKEFASVLASPVVAPKLDPLVDFSAGTIAGMAALVVGFPFDTVKVRFQDPVNAGRYTSTFSAFTRIIREERIHGLFRGIAAPMAGCAFLNGIVFGSYGLLMRAQLNHHNDIPHLQQIALAGAGSGIIASIITCPTELLKIKQQNIASASASNHMPSTSHLALQVWRKQGITGLYRGMTATALRDCGYGVYFFMYELVTRRFRRRDSGYGVVDHSSLAQEVDAELATVPWWATLLAGGLAGVASWVSTFPLDVVKTRMQSTSSRSPAYRSTLSTFIHCYRDGGLRVFFAGLSPTLIRAVPVNMVTFAVFEACVSMMTR